MDNLQIVSTYSIDVLVDKEKNILQKQEGGPAFFIERVLKKNGINALINSSIAEVEITISDSQEKGVVTKMPKNIKLGVNKLLPNLLISTVLDEFELQDLVNTSCRVWLDIQGYMRAGVDLSQFRGAFFCIKGTKEEIQKLDNSFIDSQKKRMMIVTNGKWGGEVLYEGKAFAYEPTQKLNLPNTIGAGDTFFIAFILSWLQNNSVVISCATALDVVENFLQTKQHSTSNLS